MKMLALEAPWYTFQKKVKALFAGDPDIRVGEIVEFDGGSVDYGFDIEVRNHEKFLALDRVLPKTRDYGNVTLGITLFDEENGGSVEDEIALYRTIFEGNPIVRDIKEAHDFTGTTQGYVRFEPDVIQFYDDNLEDYSGNWTGLVQDVAEEVFNDGMREVHFCTVDVRENAKAD